MFQLIKVNLDRIDGHQIVRTPVLTSTTQIVGIERVSPWRGGELERGERIGRSIRLAVGTTTR